MVFTRIVASLVVTSLNSSDHHSISAGVPQDAIWPPLFFDLYIHLLPRIQKHCLTVGYADGHTFVITIPRKEDHNIVAAHLNADLAALCEYGTQWNIKFATSKNFSLVVSLKSDISNHPPLFLNAVCIPEVSLNAVCIPEMSSVKVLDLYLTLLLPGRNILTMLYVVGRNAWASCIAVDFYLEVKGIATLYKS